MLLAIDIGNTNITLGIWNGRSWQKEWRIRTDHQRTADEYSVILLALLNEVGLRNSIQHAVMTSVVPVLTPVIAELIERYLNLPTLIVNAQTDTGIQIKTDNPAEVGADRIVNAAAAYHIFKGPSIVVDMGTATTFDVISKKGDLLGVSIAPGLRLSADALAARAAQLHAVPLTAPPSPIGRNTIHAMQSGIVFGYLALVEGMVARLKKAHPDNAEHIHIIGTGGLLQILTPHTDIIEHAAPWLTLTGLRVIHDRFQRKKA